MVRAVADGTVESAHLLVAKSSSQNTRSRQQREMCIRLIATMNLWRFDVRCGWRPVVAPATDESDYGRKFSLLRLPLRAR